MINTLKIEFVTKKNYRIDSLKYKDKNQCPSTFLVSMSLRQMHRYKYTPTERTQAEHSNGSKIIQDPKGKETTTRSLTHQRQATHWHKG